MQKYSLKTFKAAFHLVWNGFVVYSAIFEHIINKYANARSLKPWISLCPPFPANVAEHNIFKRAEN